MENKILEEISAKIEAFKKKKEELMLELMKDFPLLITPLLEKSNYLESISWAQYTPYFNDGDELIFRSNVEYLYVNGNDDTPDMYREVLWSKLSTEEEVNWYKEYATRHKYRVDNLNIGSNGYRPNTNYNAEEHEIFLNIKKVLSKIPDEFYRDLFGDHTQVTIYRDGRIEKEEYEHE